MKFLKIVLGLSVFSINAVAAPLPKFPPGAIWNQNYSTTPKHPRSDQMISWLQSKGGWGTGDFRIDLSMTVLHADASTPMVDVTGYPYDDYYVPDCEEPRTMPFPIPADGSIEGSDDYSCDNEGEDCHLLVVDGNTLYESYHSNLRPNGLQSQCAVKWDLSRVYPADGRGEQCGSADAAGYPISALLFNADEVYAAIQSGGDIGHAIRFILPNNRMTADIYVHPATHAGGPNATAANSIPYGSHFRLKANFDIDGFTDNEAVKVLLRTLKKYGMFLADGGNVPLTGEADTYTTHKWDELDFDSHSLSDVAVTDFEVLAADDPIDLTYDCVREPENEEPPPADPIFLGEFDMP